MKALEVGSGGWERRRPGFDFPPLHPVRRPQTRREMIENPSSPPRMETLPPTQGSRPYHPAYIALIFSFRRYFTTLSEDHEYNYRVMMIAISRGE